MPAIRLRQQLAIDLARFVISPHESPRLHGEGSREQRGHDILPSTGHRALVQGSHDAADDLMLLPGRGALKCRYTAQRLHHLIVSGIIAQRPAIAVSANRAVDEPRVSLLK